MAHPLLITHALTKEYITNNQIIPILKGISLTIQYGEFIALTGSSGSGKSTLMHILGCLDNPTSGSYALNNTNINTLSHTERAAIRNKTIGFIFQKFHLIPSNTITENVALPMLYAGASLQTSRTRAQELLELVGLEHRLHHYPHQLSGGQQQRVAIARALCNNPSLILADEPTGNLDPLSSHTVMNIFKTLNTTLKTTIILVTHELAIAQQTNRIIELVDGVIIHDTVRLS